VSGSDRTPRRNRVLDEGARWVQVVIVDASLPVLVEDLVAALWVAAETGDLDPADITGPDAESFADEVRAVVLYLVMNEHAGILAARDRLAALAPGTQLHALADQMRAYATDLFLTPLGVEVPDTIPDDLTNLGNDDRDDGPGDGGR